MIDVSLTLYAGDSKPIVLKVTDANGSAVDVTDSQVKMTIGKVAQPSPSQVVITLTGDVLDGRGGLIQIPIASEDTTGKSGIFFYDIQLIYPDNYKETVVKGKVEIQADVTS